MDNITFLTKPTAKAKAAEQHVRAEITRQRLTVDSPIVFAIGGDGTMLKAVRDNIDHAKTYIGISAGHLGFMQTIEPEDIPLLITALKAKTYSTISAPLLAARTKGSTDVIGYAFNDISIERNSPHAAKFSIHIGGSPGNFVGDGVIFATPLGSTAYSLAAGGPIIDTRLQNVYVVTPNNPHVSSLYSSLQRPHVMEANRTVRISVDKETLRERPLQMSFDGYGHDLTKDVEVFLTDDTISLVQLTPDGFHNRIEDKRLGRH